MKPSNWKLRRRSTGHLTQEVVQHCNHKWLEERSRSSDLLMSPIDELEDPVKKLRKNSSDETLNKMAAQATVRKKKITFASLMPTSISSRSASPTSVSRGESPILTDNDSIGSKSSIKQQMSPKTPATAPTQFTYPELLPQREVSLEEELEIRLNKITQGAQEWKTRYFETQSKCVKLSKMLMDKQTECQHVVNVLSVQYEAQIADISDKLLAAIHTSETLALDNKKLSDENKDIFSEKKVNEENFAKRIMQQNSDINVLTTDREKLTKLSHSLQSDVTILKSQNDQLQIKLNSMSRENEALKRTNSESAEKCGKLTKTVEKLQESIKDLEMEKLKLQIDKSGLVAKLADTELFNVKAREMNDEEKWSDYYNIVLDLAFDRMKVLESDRMKQKNGKKTSLPTTLPSFPRNDTDRTLVPENGNSQVDARSVGSMTSMESLLSDINDKLNTDFNENVNISVSPVPKQRSSSPLPHHHSRRGSRRVSHDHIRQGSEPLSSDSNGSANNGNHGNANSKHNGLAISYSDGNLFSMLSVKEGDELRDCIDAKYIKMHKDSVELTVPTQQSLDLRQQGLQKSFSVECYNQEKPSSRLSSLSESDIQDVTLPNVTSDPETSVSKNDNIRAHAKKANKQLNLLKRWQMNEKEKSLFPWTKRRHTHDSLKLDDGGSAFSLDPAILKEKFAFISKTRSEDDLLQCDDLASVKVTRSASITSVSSGSVDFSLDKVNPEPEHNTPSGGFHLMRIRRNGRADEAMRKKGNRPKSVDTILGGRNPMPQPESPEKTTKHKFFKRKARSVKK